MDSSQGGFYRKQMSLMHLMNSADVGDDVSCSLQTIAFISFLATHSITGHKLRQLKKLFETKLKKTL